MNQSFFVSGQTIAKADVPGLILQPVNKDPKNPFAGKITRVNLIRLDTGDKIVHVSGDTGVFNRFWNDTCELADSVTVNQIFRPKS